MPTTKLGSLTQINGRDERRAVFTTLDQVWGVNASSKYGTLDESEYRTKIDGMSKSDLWNHAAKCGLPSHDNVAALRTKLIGEFRKFVSQHSAIGRQESLPKTQSEVPEHIRKIFAN